MRRFYVYRVEEEDPTPRGDRVRYRHYLETRGAGPRETIEIVETHAMNVGTTLDLNFDSGSERKLAWGMTSEKGGE